jgi:autotransporter-associated beta strand protein
MRSDAIGFASLNTSPAGSPYKLTKVGTNQFSLVGVVVDGFLGNVEVQQGTFSVETSTFNMGNVLGDPTYTLTVFTNATLQLYNLNNALNKQIAMQDGALINNGAGNNYIAGNIALTGSNVFNVTTGSLTVNNPVTGGGALYKLGANTLSLMLNNNFGGGLFVNGGTVNLYSDNSFSGPVTVNTGNLAIDSSLSLTGSKNVMVSTSTGGGGATGSRITLGITYGGSWTVPPGVSVNLPSSQPGDLRSILYANKGYSEWQGPITFYAQAGAATPGSVAMSSDASNSVFVISGPMSGVLTNLILRGNNTGVGKVYGPINVSNPGGLSPRLEKTEVSLWTLYNNNNVWGDTIIHNGVLQLGTNNPCPVGGFMTIGENVAVSTLDLNGYNQQFSGLASAGNGISPSGANTNDFIGNSSTTSDSTFTLLGTNVTVFAGSIMDQAVFFASTNLFGSQRAGLTLAAGNTGSLTLSGPNTYTGPTMLNGGTLLVNGSLGNTVITVNNGATLGGTGLLSGPVSVNVGGTLALGPAIGTLTLSNNLTLNGSTCVAKVNPDLAINDLVQGVGTLTYGGTLVVTNVGTTSLAGGASLKLFDASAYAGSFASIVPAQPGLGLGWDTSSLAVNGTLKVVTTVNTTPTNITAAVHGNQLTLSWPADHIGWRVQTNAVNVANTNFWFTLPGSTITNEVIVPIDTTSTNVFYRMTYP